MSSTNAEPHPSTGPAGVGAGDAGHDPIQSNHSALLELQIKAEKVLSNVSVGIFNNLDYLNLSEASKQKRQEVRDSDIALINFEVDEELPANVMQEMTPFCILLIQLCKTGLPEAAKWVPELWRCLITAASSVFDAETLGATSSIPSTEVDGHDEKHDSDTELDHLLLELRQLAEMVSKEGHRFNLPVAELDLVLQLVESAFRMEPNQLHSKEGTGRLSAALQLLRARSKHLQPGDFQHGLGLALSSLQVLQNGGQREAVDTQFETFKSHMTSLQHWRYDPVANPKAELSLTTAEAVGQPIDLSHMPSCQFRLLLCRPLLEKSRIVVQSFDTLPEREYVAVSYVWQGLRVTEEEEKTGEFMTVRGAESSDPLSLNVLRSVCIAALEKGCNMVWIDRLCMKQNDSSDKVWQIKNMFQIYKSCWSCLILPGGLMRLAKVNEETTWISRAWTLQEAAACPDAYLLVAFFWESEPAVIPGNRPGFKVLEPGKSALSSLNLMLSSTSTWDEKPDDDTDPKALKLFRGATQLEVMSLESALDKEAHEERFISIWRSSFMRSSSRPVDMVLSIMGLMEVELDPAAYGPDERHRALQDLARALSAKGQRAYWLGFLPWIDPDPRWSLLPQVPETSVGGKVEVVTSRGSELLRDVIYNARGFGGAGYVYTPNPPYVAMTDDSYVTFEGRAGLVEEVTDGTNTKEEDLVRGQTGRDWAPVKSALEIDGPDSGRLGITACIVLGGEASTRLGRYPMVFSPNLMAMVVRRDKEDKWVCLEYGSIDGRVVDELAWNTHKFTVGSIGN